MLFNIEFTKCEEHALSVERAKLFDKEMVVKRWKLVIITKQQLSGKIQGSNATCVKENNDHGAKLTLKVSKLTMMLYQNGPTIEEDQGPGYSQFSVPSDAFGLLLAVSIHGLDEPVQFLRHVIDSKGIHVDHAKIESIKDWESPKTPTEIRHFLGLFNCGEKEETAFQTLNKEKELAYAPANSKSTEELHRTHDLELGAVNVCSQETGELRYPTRERILNAHIEARNEEENYGTHDSSVDNDFKNLVITCRRAHERNAVVLKMRKYEYSNADKRRKPLEFQVGDKVMLKVSPWKGVIHFGKRGKLNPHYIGPFKILAKVGTVAYRLKLPEKLSRVYSTFQVSNLKKCLSDEPLAIPLDEIHVDDKLNFIKEPVEIMDREVKSLKKSHIPIVKVHWNSRRGLEYTWEREDRELDKVTLSSSRTL
ncbi:hypothetical protein Tco_0510863 [Tanacetum coccineum]